MLLIFNYIFIAHANACSFVWQARGQSQEQFWHISLFSACIQLHYSFFLFIFPWCGRTGPFSNSLQKVTKYQKSPRQECRHPGWWMVMQALIELSQWKLFSLKAAAVKWGWHHLEFPACVYELTLLLMESEKILARQRWKLPLRLYASIIRAEGADAISLWSVSVSSFPALLQRKISVERTKSKQTTVEITGLAIIAKAILLFKWRLSCLQRLLKQIKSLDTEPEGRGNESIAWSRTC